MKKILMYFRLMIILILITVIADCKKEDQTPETAPVEDQLLGDTDAELLTGVFWTSSPSINGFTNGRVEEVYRSPTHSFKLSRTISDPLLSAYYMQTYQRQMPYGEDLTLNAHIKGVNIEGSGVAIAILCQDDKFGRLQIAATDTISGINGTFDWKLY
ncbi:MAG: hypothetical protein HZB98_11880, partial [Bacteroidia bacterium]|nr:hypothetical protein [Bacteroidia bacterium]